MNPSVKKALQRFAAPAAMGAGALGASLALSDEAQAAGNLSEEESDALFESAPTLSEEESDALFESAVQESPGVGSVLADKAIGAGEGIVDTLKSLGQSGLDAATGVAEGLAGGALSELGGVANVAREKLQDFFDPTNKQLKAQGFDVQEMSAADAFRAGEEATGAEISESRERSPYLTGAGELAGAFTGGAALMGATGVGAGTKGAKSILDIAKQFGGGKAALELLKRGGKSYVAASPFLAAEGALSSEEGKLIGGTETEKEKLGADVVGSLAFGVPAIFGMQGVQEVAGPALKKSAQSIGKKVDDLISESPLLRQMGIAKEYGEKGIDLRKESNILQTDLGKTGLSELDNTRSRDIMNEIYEADNVLGRAVGDSIDKAEAAGRMINLDKSLSSSFQRLSKLEAMYPDLTQNPKARTIYGKLVENAGIDLPPSESKVLIDYLDSYINKFKSASSKTPLESDILSDLIKTRQSISSSMKSQLPEYALAAERFAKFRQMVPETIIAGKTPQDITDNFFGDLKKQDEKLFTGIKKMVQQTTRRGSSSQDVREAFVQSVKGMKQFEADDIARGVKAQRLGVQLDPAFKRPVSSIEEQIKKYSDDAIARGSVDTVQPSLSATGSLKDAALGVGEAGISKLYSAANKYGLYKDKVVNAVNPLVAIGKTIYNAPENTVRQLSQSLKNTSGLQNYGDALEKALTDGDLTRRNQVLFTIMQNPSARALIDAGDIQDEEFGEE